MQSRGSSNRLSSTVVKTPISSLLFFMFATLASIYVAGRLWQDAQNRVHMIKELDRITGLGQSAISVDDTLKIIACREQQKKLTELEMQLATARQEGFGSKSSVDTNDNRSEKRPLVVIGILTKFGRKKNRDAIRKAWMGTGTALKKLENDKGIIARFVIGRSGNHGNSLDKGIDSEHKQTNDFIILENHVESPEEFPKKAKLFFAYAADKWDAEFYAKVNDDIYVNIDAVGATLATYVDKPRAYIGCMKPGASKTLSLFVLLLLSSATIAFSDGEDCVYTVYIRTGSIFKGGTDSIISLRLYNMYGEMVEMTNLESWGGLMGPGYNYFERGNLDIFSGRGKCLSAPVCAMNLTSDGSGPHHGWYVNYVEVTSTGVHTPCSQQQFTVEQWLALDTTPFELTTIRNYCPDYAARGGQHEGRKRIFKSLSSAM